MGVWSNSDQALIRHRSNVQKKLIRVWSVYRTSDKYLISFSHGHTLRNVQAINNCKSFGTMCQGFRILSFCKRSHKNDGCLYYLLINDSAWDLRGNLKLWLWRYLAAAAQTDNPLYAAWPSVWTPLDGAKVRVWDSLVFSDFILFQRIFIYTSKTTGNSWMIFCWNFWAVRSVWLTSTMTGCCDTWTQSETFAIYVWDQLSVSWVHYEHGS